MPGMALTVTFDGPSSSGAAVIKAPAFVGQPVQLGRQFVSDRTADGTRYTYQMTSSTKWEWELSFRDLSLSEKRDLEGFFRNNVRGPSLAFSYTHSDGSTYTARFAQDVLPWVRDSKELWSCTVRIETTSEPL